jgi:hypothetical protein
MTATIAIDDESGVHGEIRLDKTTNEVVRLDRGRTTSLFNKISSER